MQLVIVKTELCAQQKKEVDKGFIARQNEKNKQLEEEKKINASNGINVSGVIVDENGKPLDDVVMNIRFSRLNLKKWGTTDYKKKVTTKSKFILKQAGYSFLMIDFRKEGYFPVRKKYSLYKRSKYRKNNSFSKNNEKVVMRKIGKKAKLIKFDKKLKYNFINKTQTICNMSSFAYIKCSADEKNKYSNYICLDFERDQDEKVLTRKNLHGELIPTTLIIRYVSDSIDDGFIIKGEQKDITYLTQAPDANYNTKEIKVPYNVERIYFYYKNGGSYGKGFVGYAYTAFKESRVVLFLMQNIETNPQEKLNLRSDKRL